MKQFFTKERHLDEGLILMLGVMCYAFTFREMWGMGRLFTLGDTCSTILVFSALWLSKEAGERRGRLMGLLHSQDILYKAQDIHNDIKVLLEEVKMNVSVLEKHEEKI